MIDTEKVKKLIKDRKTFWNSQGMTSHPQFDELYTKPLIEALGDDEEEIKQFLCGCNEEDLSNLCGIFEYIYEKFLNDDMYDYLDEMEIKAGLHS